MGISKLIAGARGLEPLENTGLPPERTGIGHYCPVIRETSSLFPLIDINDSIFKVIHISNPYKIQQFSINKVFIFSITNTNRPMPADFYNDYR